MATATATVTASSARHAAALGLASAALYSLAPLLGAYAPYQWDALMSASVLARPDVVRTDELLFFAHPLVIPLTWPFALLTGDPLLATALREACFGGIVVALAFLGVRAATGSRAAGVVAAALLTLAASRWRLATAGEEKEVALAFGGAFLFLYMDHRRLWDLGLPRWRAARPIVRQVILSALLAAAMAVHLVNGLLVLVVAIDLALERRGWRDGAVVLAGAAAIALPFFLWLAIGPGGARTPGGVAAHYLEYHLSGEFVTAPASSGGRLVDAWLGARAWLIGPRACPAPVAELLVALAVTGGLVWRALRTAPGPSTRLLIWIGLCTAHFWFYEPWDPEAWGPVALAWVTVAAIGLGGARVPIGVAAAALLALAISDAALLRAPTPPSMREVVHRVDRQLEPDAILLVEERLDASWFHIYSRRDPIVRDYLDVSRDELRREYLLTALSLRFYAPSMTSTEIAASGRPVYLLGADLTLSRVAP